MSLWKSLKLDWNTPATRRWIYAFTAVSLIRFLSVIPFVIDDDESWWVPAARALRTPWEYYFRAVDHKPPGIVWFYWFLNQLVDTNCDPRVTRAFFTLLLVIAAGVVGWLAQRVFRDGEEEDASRKRGWMAATLFLVGTAIGLPKLFSVTSDGVMNLFVVAGYAVALACNFRGFTILAGALLAGGILIKQTGVFFALPILLCRYPRKFRWTEIAGFAVGSLLVLIPSILALDLKEFVYWNWTYPAEVLVGVRDRIHHPYLQFVTSLIPFVALLFPLLWWASRSSAVRKWSFWLRDFRALWLLTGILVMWAGKGMFLHYFVSIAPPLALLAAMNFREFSLKSFSEKWLYGWYAVAGLLVCFQFTGIFWNSDLPYFKQLGQVIKTNVRPGERILVWGGSAFPLTYSGVPFVSRFVLPRFGAIPYANERTLALFHEEVANDVPSMVVDLHERSDNRFNNPMESDPFIADLVKKNFRPYIEPTLPWAKFYLRAAPPAGSTLEALSGPGDLARVYGEFPRFSEVIRELTAKPIPLSPAGLRDRDFRLRSKQGLQLLAQQSTNATLRAEARELLTADRERVRTFLGRYPELPTNRFFWWPQLIFVKLTPGTI